MTGTMKVGKLKKNAVYYYHKDYDERVGGAFIFFIMPMRNNDVKPFFYVKPQSDERLELSGEAYIITGERLSRYIRKPKRIWVE